MAENMNSPADMPEPPREERDASFRVVAGFGVGLLALLGVLSLLLVGLFAYVSTHDAKSDVLPSMVTPQLPPEPRLEVVPADTVAKLRATEDALLNDYAWVDRQHGIVRIPIAEAMILLAKQGLPVRTASGQQILEF